MSCVEVNAVTVASYPTICRVGAGKICITITFNGPVNFTSFLHMDVGPTAIGPWSEFYFSVNNWGNPGTSFTFCTDVPLGTYYYRVRFTDAAGSAFCTYTGFATTFITDYNTLPLTISILNQTNAGCTSQGSITALFSGDITEGIFVELRQGLTIVQSAHLFTNSYTFPGLPPGNYTIRNYRQFPPGNPQYGLQSTCWFDYEVVIAYSCVLKCTDCNDPLVVRYIDGTGNLLLIGTTIYGFINGKQACWSITEDTHSIDSTIGTYIGPYGTCQECDINLCTGVLSNIIGTADTCDQCIGTSTVTPSTGTGPYTYEWDTSPAQTTQTITGLCSGTYSVIITDSLGCIGTNTITIGNTCIRSYLITPCDPSIQPFVITDPISSPDTNPDNYVGFFNGVITLPNTTVSGCVQMQTWNQTGVTGALISVTQAYSDCLSCTPPNCILLTRCDDPGITITLSGIDNPGIDLLTGKVINGINLENCVLDCSHVLPEQCWLISIVPPCNSNTVLVSYNELLTDCTCCKPCL